MTLEEFSNGFDLYYNNITSNQAPGLNEWEKSMFLTKAEKEIVKNYFSAGSVGNTLKQGFDDSAKRQADFSCLMMTSECDNVSFSGKIVCTNEDGTEMQAVDPSDITFNSLGEGVPFITLDDLVIEHSYPVTYSSGYNVLNTDKGAARLLGFPFNGGTFNRKATIISSKINPNSFLFSFPSDVFIAINESLSLNNGRILQVVPLRYDEYLRLMSKPYKRPLKNQAWRLMNYGIGNKANSSQYVEIIPGPQDIVSTYIIRYIRTPLPIIISPLTEDDLSIDGYKGATANGVPLSYDSAATPSQGIECELDPILHEDILQRAVELAKVAWTQTGGDNTQAVIQAGQRSE